MTMYVVGNNHETAEGLPSVISLVSSEPMLKECGVDRPELTGSNGLPIVALNRAQIISADNSRRIHRLLNSGSTDPKIAARIDELRAELKVAEETLSIYGQTF